MRSIGLLCISSSLVLGSCGSGGDDPAPDTSGGSRTVVVNESTFVATGVETLVSHLTVPASSTAALVFETGPGAPPVGVGSGEWRIGADGDSGLELRFDVLDDVPLSDVTRLSFWTYVEYDFSGLPAVAVNLSMRIDWDDDGDEDDRIYFEPVYQHLPPLDVPEQGALLLGTWQSWDALGGGWYSNNDPSFTLVNGVSLLADYLAAHPLASVVAHTDGSGGTRLNAGYGTTAWDNFIGNADALEVGILGDVLTFDLDP